MKSILYIIAAILILPVFGSALLYWRSFNVQQEWVKRYNGPDNGPDGATSIAVDDSGNIYVTGISWGGVFGGSRDDYVTIKYSPTGSQLWVQRYNGIYNGYDAAYSIAVDDSSNAVVTGTADGDYTTIKYSPAGVIKWLRTYRGTENLSDTDFAYMVKTDKYSNVYVTGTSTGAFGTYRDYATVKYNSSGVQQWAARYNGPIGGYDEAYSLAVDDSGNIYVTGASLGVGTQHTDIATVKYNQSGLQQWVQRYTGVVVNYSYNKGNSIGVDRTGNIYVTGSGYVTQGLGAEFTTIKYNSSGVQQWVRGYNGTSYGSYDEAYAIAVDSLGNVYVTGMSSGGITTSVDYATVKYNTAGVQLWVQRWNGPANGEDRAHSLALDSSGNVYVTGVTYWGLNNGDYATVKYTSTGKQEWVQLYNGEGNGNDGAGSIEVDKLANVYVTGSSLGIGTGSDYATIKYSQLVGINPITNEIPREHKLYQNYPNPFNPVTKIKYDIPLLRGVSEGRGVSVTLKVYDIVGREIATLINEHLKPGTYEVEWDASNYPSGVYFYKLSTVSFVDTKKMVLIK